MTMSIADDPQVVQLIELARREDLGEADITSALLEDPRTQASFRLQARQPGTFAGRDVAEAVLHSYDPAIQVDWSATSRDGASWQQAPTTLAMLRGPLARILEAERVMLNFLQRLSGIATLTRKYVDAVQGTSAAIYDTRKTIPGWRKLDKYAVRCGGGANHRTGLFDAVLIKDNHLAGVPAQRLAAHVFQMLNRLDPTGRAPDFVEVEVTSLDQLAEILKVVGIHLVMLDNFSVEQLRSAVDLRESCGLAGKVALEASGGIHLGNVRQVAQTGVERISVGALTHSALALDIGLDRI